jgi:hypothetical protein
MKATIVDAHTTVLRVGETVTFPNTKIVESPQHDRRTGSPMQGHWTVVAVHESGRIDVTHTEHGVCCVMGLNPAIGFNFSRGLVNRTSV